ncbi:hypothetical protein ACGFIU_19475 [Rhodococcus oryzae]|uniref:hypothetical protein n=1 Tax=Rhodococcus oryzae TaxID=2571143 RepID=UPI0037199234
MDGYRITTLIYDSEGNITSATTNTLNFRSLADAHRIALTAVPECWSLGDLPLFEGMDWQAWVLVSPNLDVSRAAVAHPAVYDTQSATEVFTAAMLDQAEEAMRRRYATT